VRFFRPGLNLGNRFSPGESRRRRARYQEHLQQQDTLAAVSEADELSSLHYDFWGAPGRILATEPCEARPHSTEPTDGALRIVSGCAYDPGNAAFRHHTAINECTKHADAFVRFGHSNPFCDLRQIDGGESRRHIKTDARAAVYTADVIHAHVDYSLQALTGFKWRARPEQLVIRHYHGTRWDTPAKKQWPMVNMMEDDLANVTLVGARLTLCELRPSRMQWLPIAIPTRRYRAMVPKERRPGPFRVAHSPTRSDYKGSADLQIAVDALRRMGLKVELVMIEKQPHGVALELKANADLTFDSFWLGIQGSGLEAAAMGQMVVAGDESVRDLYNASEVGQCPYTFAGDRKQLIEVLERAITDNLWYASETTRVARYVKDYHDYAAVARRYEQIIATAKPEWSNVATKKPRGKHVAA